MEADTRVIIESGYSNYPKKKRIDPVKDKKSLYLSDYMIKTNLKKLNLNQNALKGVFLFGCDIKRIDKEESELNKVHVMRIARRIAQFKEVISKHIENHYIFGCMAVGKPKDEDKEFSFALSMREKKDPNDPNGKTIVEGEVLEQIPDEKEIDDLKEKSPDSKIYLFKFTKKIEFMESMDTNAQSDSNQTDSSLIQFNQLKANYLNICLSYLLKDCGYIKDRTSRKFLYYKQSDIFNGILIGVNDRNFNADTYRYFNALKAVIDTFDGGKIFLKVLPKRILRTDNTFQEYFDYLYSEDNRNIKTKIQEFAEIIKGKRGIKYYNQEIMKIEDVIFENPSNLKFDSKEGETNVRDYLMNNYRDRVKDFLGDGKMPIAVRYIDKGGKLKGDERLKVYVPCCLLQTYGNIYNVKIDVRGLVQKPFDKHKEIEKITEDLTINSKKGKGDELKQILGSKFEPVEVQANVLNPPKILFGDEYTVDADTNGNFEIRETTPFSTPDLGKSLVFLLGINDELGGFMWNKLVEASKTLGITINFEPEILNLEEREDFEAYFKSRLNESFVYDKNKKDDDIIGNKTNLVKHKIIFLFMSSRNKYKDTYYQIFKKCINEKGWKIPTQVILYNEKKMSSHNLSQFTNILCQIWAKRGKELYACNFDFIPQTIVVSYSSIKIIVDGINKVLTSLCISFGETLYEYLYYSQINEPSDSPNYSGESLKNLLGKGLKDIGKYITNVDNIVFYRDGVNEKMAKSIQENEINDIMKVLNNYSTEEFNNKKPYEHSKICFVMAAKFNDIKFFESAEDKYGNPEILNIRVGSVIDSGATSENKFDFFLNSAASIQGTCSPTHYTVLKDDTNLTGIQIFKLTYYLTYLTYNTTKSIKMPAPLYYVTRRNNFTRDNLKSEVINSNLKLYNISL